MRNALPVRMPHSDRSNRAKKRALDRTINRIKRRIAGTVKGHLREKVEERSTAAAEDEAAGSVVPPTGEL